MANGIEQYPEKSFAEYFAEKESALEAIWTPAEQIKNKKEEFIRFFQYDNNLTELKKKLDNYDWDLDSFIVDRIKFHFWEISKFNSWLSNLNFANPNDVNSIFQNFTNNLNSTGYNNNITLSAGWRNVSFWKTVLDEFILEVNSILNSIDSSNLEGDKKQIGEAIKMAEKLVKNSSKYEDAIITAENWIQAEWKALSSSLQDKAEIFNTKAEEHKFITSKIVWLIKWWNWIWLAWSILSWISAIILVIYFILETWVEISVWASLLRISVLIVISYFTFFSLSQFSNNKKLYEIYKFKAIALKTMDELIKGYSEDKGKILDKAMSIVFNEPTLKEEWNTQQKLLDYSMEIIKKKI